jgi:ABC-2 type transport system ATP-binding protein
VDENIDFFAEIHGVTHYEQERERLLEFTRLTPFRKRLADKLSGGMKQKLALACTLIHTPNLIFLYEPTTGVDPVSRRDFWLILSDLLEKGLTIVVTTPYLDEAERGHRVGFLDKGQLLTVATPGELKNRLARQVLEIICDQVRTAYAVLQQLAVTADIQLFGDRLDLIITSEQQIPLLLAGLKAAGINVFSCQLIPPRLENVFMALMKEKKSRKHEDEKQDESYN